MFHLLQDFLVAAESPDLHGFEVGPSLPQIPSSLATLALAALANMLATLGKDETGVRGWICQLPAATREKLLRELEDTKVKENEPSSSSSLQLLDRSWRLLFSSDWRRVIVRTLVRQVKNQLEMSSKMKVY